MKDRRDQIGERLSRPRPRLDEERVSVAEGRLHRFGHLELARAPFVGRQRVGNHSARSENLGGDRGNAIDLEAGTSRLVRLVGHRLRPLQQEDSIEQSR